MNASAPPAGHLGPAVTAEAVAKTIGAVTLLAPTSLYAAPGRALVVRGRNGIGKTTLLRILAGTLAPTSGSVWIGDAVADERDRRLRRTVAALLGAPATYRDLTLEDHLTLVDATWGGDADTCEERVHAALAQLGIDALSERFPHELSSGQSQLFRLALVLFRPSQLLILDEPEQRLDTTKRELVAGLLAARRDAGTTVLVASHDPTLTDALADEVLDLGWEFSPGDVGEDEGDSLGAGADDEESRPPAAASGPGAEGRR